MITGNSKYAKMMMPFPSRVWRYRLLPVSVGHYSLLSRLDHPLIDGENILGAGDLAVCLWLFSRPWEDAQAKLGGYWFSRHVRKIGRKFQKDVKLFNRVLHSFYAWWAWQNETYDIWENEENQKGDRSMSWLQTLRWVIVKEWGLSHQEFMDMPYKLAVNDALGAMVASGKLEFVSDKQMARRQFLESRMKERAKA